MAVAVAMPLPVIVSVSVAMTMSMTMIMPMFMLVFVLMIMIMFFLLILSIIAIKELPIILIHFFKNSSHHNLIILEPSLIMRAAGLGILKLEPSCLAHDSHKEVCAHCL